MPIKLVPPRPGKTKVYYGRGSYLGVAVDRSTKAADLRVAKSVIRRWEAEIERGQYRKPSVEPVAAPDTFLAAAVAYMQAGGERKYIGPIIELTGPHALRDRRVDDIDQIAIDNACNALFPRGTAQTKNRQFYTPISAVLKRAGVEKPIKRPKGWRGKKSTSWLEPDQAFRLLAAASAIDAEFGLLLRTVLYTGMRLGETLKIELRHLDLTRGTIYLPETKNGEARSVHLPPALVTAFANQPPRQKRDGGRSQADAGIGFLHRHAEAHLFRFHPGGAVRDMLKRAMHAAGLAFPRRQRGFHIFCHTYGTWMHRYGGLDTYGLTRTERWKDPRSADRYKHTAVSEEARRADLLPVESAPQKPGISVENVPAARQVSDSKQVG